MQIGFDLRSGETYPSVWIPSDPTDTNTYYPQAVFRKGLDFSVIATVNLSKQVDGSYMGAFLVPTDSTNLGTIIIETTTVYTDSGYTTPSTVYGIGQLKHKISNFTQNYGGGGGYADLTDYKHIEKTVKKLIEEAIKKISIPKQVDLTETGKSISKLFDLVNSTMAYIADMDARAKEHYEKEIIFPNGEYSEHFAGISQAMEEHKEYLESKYNELDSKVKSYIDGQHIADHEAFDKSHKELTKKIDNYLNEIKNDLEYRFENVDYLAYKRGTEPKRKQEVNNYEEMAKSFLN